MKLQVQNGIIRGLPLALLVTFLVQGASFVWWISARTRDAYFLEQRVGELEGGLTQAKAIQAQSIERLIRIEERLQAQSVTLDRIDKKLPIRQAQ